MWHKLLELHFREGDAAGAVGVFQRMLESRAGVHFAPADVVDTFAPSAETVRRVTEWLVGEGVARERLRMSASRGWIEFNTTVAEAEALIDAEYHVYAHPSGAEQISECLLALGAVRGLDADAGTNRLPLVLGPGGCSRARRLDQADGAFPSPRAAPRPAPEALV